LGGRAPARQNRSFHRRLLIATEPLTVAAVVCPDGPTGTAERLPLFGTSPLGVPAVTPPITLLFPT